MNEEQYHIIELYLSAKLNDAEKLQFEAALKSDAELADSLSMYKMLNRDMPLLMKGKENDEALRKTLFGSSQKYFYKSQPKIPSLRKGVKVWFAAAASVIIILSTLLLNQQKKISEEVLYAQFMDTSDISLVTRDTASQEDLSNATAFYNSHDYASVIPLLEKVLQSDFANLKYKMTLSRCYIETGNYDKAEYFLKQVGSSESAYKYEAIWLQALSLLKQKRRADCIALLQTIPAKADSYSIAHKLIKKLR